MKKDDNIFLAHILESIELIESFLKGKNRNSFDKSRQLQDAVYHRLEIVGEAANNLSEKFKKENLHVDWSLAIAMRNKLIHEYFGIDKDVVWGTVKKDLPNLKKEIKKLLK